MQTRNQDRRPLLATTTSLLAGLRGHGFVVVRGRAVDEGSFVALTEQLSERFTCDPAKERDTALNGRAGGLGACSLAVSRLLDKMPSKLASRRSNGTRAAPSPSYGINPHNENSYIPGAFPELVWFRCERPAPNGGTTLLCDGTEVLASLSEAGRKFAEEEPVRYELTFSAAHWRNLYDFDEPAQLAEVLDNVGGLTWSLDRRGRLSYVFDAPQTGVTLFDQKRALRTNVLSRRPFSDVGQSERERTRDGSPMPSWFVCELLDAVERASSEVALDAGDVIVIDNTRMMHGRTPFEGNNRRVLTRCGFVRPELLRA